jgi:hypothetical protein
VIDYSPSPKPLNGSQFSQLPLFTMKPDAANRWPRGYTPERLHEVTDAMAASSVTSNVATPRPAWRPKPPSWETGPSTPPKIEPQMFKPYKEFRTKIEDRAGLPGPTDDSELKATNQASTQARHAIIDTIARSSIPRSDLFREEQLTKDVGSKERRVPNFHVQDIQGASGTYQRPGWIGVPPKGVITVRPEAREHSEHTVVHEMGHSADYQRDPWAFAERQQNDPRPSPRLEGFAEGYAFKHTQRGADVPYKKVAAYGDMHHLPDFARRFQEVSGSTPQEAMRESMGPQFQPLPEQDPNGPHLYQRRAEKSMTDANPDRGQFPLGQEYYDESKPLGQRSESNEVGTITVGRGLAAPAWKDESSPLKEPA